MELRGHQPLSESAGDRLVDGDALPAGTLVAHYRIVSLLGRGGFGITYRALDVDLKREVALKEFLPTACAVRADGATVQPRSTRSAEEFVSGRERFIAEGRTLASLEHAPGIVRVYDLVQANGTAYIVMKLLSGRTLQEVLSQRPCLLAGEVRALLLPLLEGLEQVHAAGFLHRDIKPSNILVDASGSATLIDFGAARAVTAGNAMAATAIFTPGYAAVEQFAGGNQGPWTDIYGLAATLHQAIVGSPPPSALDRLLEDKYVPLATRQLKGVDASLSAAIDAGLQLKSEDRPQSIDAWRNLMRRAADSEQTLVLHRTTTAPAAAKPAWFKRTATWVALGSTLLVAAGAGAWMSQAGRTAAIASTQAPAFAPSDVPFIRSRCFKDCVQPYLDAEGPKALALDPRGYIGSGTKEADEASARTLALKRCNNEAKENTPNWQWNGEKCEIFAIDDRIVWPHKMPPMPRLPYVPDSRPDPPGVFDAAQVPLLKSHLEVDTATRYRSRPTPKAFVMGKGGRYWWNSSQDSEQDAARVLLQKCGAATERQCVVLALNDQAILRLPQLYRMVDVVAAENLPPALDAQKDSLTRYFIANDWRAIAVAANNLMGLAAGQPTEAQAVRAAVADCAAVGGTDCKVRAIGPFLVEP